jgi:hypothetical protein
MVKVEDKWNQEWNEGEYKNMKKEQDILADEKHGEGEEYGKVECN